MSAYLREFAINPMPVCLRPAKGFFEEIRGKIMTTIKAIIIFAFCAIIFINTAAGQDKTTAEGFLKIAEEFRKQIKS